MGMVTEYTKDVSIPTSISTIQGEISMSEKRSVEDRLDQIEKDIEELAFGYGKLLTWKRNQATRILPTQHSLPTQHKDPNGEELLDDADERAKRKKQNWVTE